MPIKIYAAWWCCDRASRSYHPGYGKRPTLDAQPHPHAPSLADWLKSSACKRLILVDPYGVYPHGQGAITNAMGARTVSRAVWGGSETAGNAFIREVRSAFDGELLAFIGAVPFVSRATAHTLLMDHASHAIELADLIGLGVRPIIDTAGWLCCDDEDSPTKWMLASPGVREAVDVEGWGAGTPRWFGGHVWLGPDEARLYSEGRQAPLDESVALWLQGSEENQRAGLRLAGELGIGTVCMEPTVFGERWNAMVEEVGGE